MKRMIVALCVLSCWTTKSNAEDSRIVNQYGQPTGYRVQAPAGQASLHEMLEAGQAINTAKNAPTAAVSDGIAAGIQQGYQQANDERLRREIDAAAQRLAGQDKPHFDAMVYAEAELAARFNRLLEDRCTKNPKHPSCSEDRSQIPAIVDGLLMSNDLILIPRSWWQNKKTPE